MPDNAFLRAIHDAAKDIAHLDDELKIARAAVDRARRVIDTKSCILLLANTDALTSFAVRATSPDRPDIRFPPLEDLHVEVRRNG